MENMFTCRICHVPGGLRYDWKYRDDLRAQESSEALDRQGVNIEIGRDVYRRYELRYAIIMEMKRSCGISFYRTCANEVDEQRKRGAAVNNSSEDNS